MAKNGNNTHINDDRNRSSDTAPKTDRSITGNKQQKKNRTRSQQNGQINYAIN